MFDIGPVIIILVIVVGLPLAVWLGVRMLRDPGDGPGGT